MGLNFRVASSGRLANKIVFKSGFSKVHFIEICITFDSEIRLGWFKMWKKEEHRENNKELLYFIRWKKIVNFFYTPTKPLEISFILEESEVMEFQMSRLEKEMERWKGNFKKNWMPWNMKYIPLRNKFWMR